MNTAVTWGDLFWIAVGLVVYFGIVKPFLTGFMIGLRGRRRR